eukprot:TRINITY_DN2462_c0_g1_i1.p1 TRINITY_DN2462_c0_g1~~TRINITY_DN2462_c0_g1_i1.p1  ORF type:complete len:403 (-),score=68.83 TRINITY_DN2462_c0_g1_i1:34-1242(-)
MKQFLTKYICPNKIPAEEFNESIQRDIIGHFVLRLAYCSTENREWFINQEKALLKLRAEMNEGGVSNILSNFGLDYPVLSEEEHGDILEQLEDVWRARSNGRYERNHDRTKYRVVPFEMAIDLLSFRKVYLRGGNAYVHEKDLLSIVLKEFRIYLSKCLDVAHQMKGNTIANDERIENFVNKLPNQYLGTDYIPNQNKENTVDINSLDELSATSFPLCMERLHIHLRRTHHLKHHGRLQYGLFLKGIGLTLEDALDFWRREADIAGKNFDKDYSYGVKHNYGKVGKRTSYTPYSCKKLMSLPRNGEVHGCPYKIYNSDLLRQTLDNKGLSKSEIRNVIQLKEAGEEMEACKCTFDAIHPGAPNFSIIHPNQYYDKSVKYKKAEKEFVGVKQNPEVHSEVVYK